MSGPNCSAATLEPQAGVLFAELRQRRLRKRLRAWVPKLHLYQLPGYGPVYRWSQRFIHGRGRCVMVRGPVMDDGSRLWKCNWCGHRIPSLPSTYPEKRLSSQAGGPS